MASIASSLRALAITGVRVGRGSSPAEAFHWSSTNLRKKIVNRAVVAYATTVFFLVLSLLMFFPSRMLADGATYWELVVGRQILRVHSFPNVDQYSHTASGGFVDRQGMAIPSLALYSLRARRLVRRQPSHCGDRGVSLFDPVRVALPAPQPDRRPGDDRRGVFARFGLLARPVGDLFLSAPHALRLRPRRRRRAQESAMVATPLVSLWANLHASFPIALVLAGLFGLEALASAAPGERFRTGAKWALALLAALAATGATPYGYQPLLVFFNIVGSKELAYIDEWRPIPFDFSGAYGVAFIAGSLAIVAAARAGWTRAAPIALCGALMIMHVRFFPLFAIVAAAAVATPLGRRFPRFARQPFPPSKATGLAAVALLAAASLTAVSVLLLAARPIPSPKMTPSAALAAARECLYRDPYSTTIILADFDLQRDQDFHRQSVRTLL